MSPTACRQSESDGSLGIEAGVDWITAIAATRNETDALAAVAIQLGREERERGHPVKPFRFMGWSGQMCGGVRLGFQGASSVVQLSGELCSSSWNRLPSTCGRITRLDLQTTVTLSTSQPKFARSLLRTSTAGRRRFHQSPPRIAYSSDTSGLAIGTVGSRTNDRYFRVYDKGVEKRIAPAGTLWRIELEAKHALAPMLWSTMQQQKDVPGWCYGTCESHWKSLGLSWRLPSSSDPLEVQRAKKREPAPAHVLGAWLRTSVAPTIPRVLTAFTIADLLEMLGIDHLAEPRTQGPNDA